MMRSGTSSKRARSAKVAGGIIAIFASVGCAGTAPGGGPDGDATPTSTAAKGVEEVAVALGQSADVADLTATVEEVRRQKAFGGTSDLGYLVAKVNVVNNSKAARDYHRLQFRLIKPDGSSINRTPIAGVTQLGTGTLQPGDRVGGELIFTVEQVGGRFSVVYEPIQEGAAERKRGVWAFDSQPGDAR
jgi:hypothetical protein